MVEMTCERRVVGAEEAMVEAKRQARQGGRTARHGE